MLRDRNWGDSKEILSPTPQPIGENGVVLWWEEKTQWILVKAILNWREGITRPRARRKRHKRRAKVKRKSTSIAIILMLRDCNVLGTFLIILTHLIP